MSFFNGIFGNPNKNTSSSYQEASAYDYGYDKFEGEASQPYYPGEKPEAPAQAPAAPAPAPAPAQQPAGDKAKKRRLGTARTSIGQKAEAREASAPKGENPYQRNANGSGMPQTVEDTYEQLLYRGYGASVAGILGDEYRVLYHFVERDGTTRYARAERVLWYAYQQWWNGESKSYDINGAFNLPQFLEDLKQVPHTAFRLWPEEQGRPDRRKLALAGEEAEALMLLHDAALKDLSARVQGWLEEHPNKAEALKEKQPEATVGFGLPKHDTPQQEASDEQFAKFMAQMGTFMEFMQQQSAQTAAPAPAAPANPAPAPDPVPAASAQPAAPANSAPDPAPADQTQAATPVNPTPAPAPDPAASAQQSPAPAAGNSDNQDLMERINASTSSSSTEIAVRAVAQGSNGQQQAAAN